MPSFNSALWPQKLTKEEVLHDNAVLEALNNGRPIREPLASAGDKYPEERMQWDETTIADIAAHYEYLQEHMKILEKLRKRTASHPQPGSFIC